MASPFPVLLIFWSIPVVAGFAVVLKNVLFMLHYVASSCCQFFFTFRLTFVTFIAACVCVCQSEWVCECLSASVWVCVWWKMPRSCPSSFWYVFPDFSFFLSFFTPLCRSSCCCWYCCCRFINSCCCTEKNSL